MRRQTVRAATPPRHNCDISVAQGGKRPSVSTPPASHTSSGRSAPASKRRLEEEERGQSAKEESGINRGGAEAGSSPGAVSTGTANQDKRCDLPSGVLESDTRCLPSGGSSSSSSSSSRAKGSHWCSSKVKDKGGGGGVVGRGVGGKKARQREHVSIRLEGGEEDVGDDKNENRAEEAVERGSDNEKIWILQLLRESQAGSDATVNNDSFFHRPLSSPSSSSSTAIPLFLIFLIKRFVILLHLS
jgi:hypothetical protein